MGQIVMSNTEQIPKGFHLATTEERKCLPGGSRYFTLGGLVDSECVGASAADATYICPDAPETVAPVTDAPETDSGWDLREHIKTAKWEVPANPPPLDPKRAAGALKPQLQLIPPVFNEAVAAALSHGAGKYGPWNWRENKVEMMTYLGAMKRHIDALLDGEDIAPDSGVHHLGHIAASCAIVLDAGKHGTLVDNRPPQKP